MLTINHTEFERSLNFCSFAMKLKGCSDGAEIIPNEPGTGNAV